MVDKKDPEPEPFLGFFTYKLIYSGCDFLLFQSLYSSDVEWVEKIESIYYDSNKLKKISESGKSTIMKEYKIENFTNNLEKLILK